MKGIKKVFKKKLKILKKIWKPVVIAAAIYFTGGLALSAFPSTAGFAASLPGFGISATGTATGVFSQAASAMGLAGGLQAGAAANAAAGATAATAAGAATAAEVAAASGTQAAIASHAPSVATALGAETTAAITGSTVAATKAATALSLTDKLLIAQMGTKAVGAVLAPDTDEVYEAQRKWRGAFYGVNGDGSRDLMPEKPDAPAQPVEASRQTNRPNEQASGVPLPEAPTPPSPTMNPIDKPKRELMSPEEPAQQRAPQQPVTNDPIELVKQRAPGVRYL